MNHLNNVGNEPVPIQQSHKVDATDGQLPTGLEGNTCMHLSCSFQIQPTTLYIIVETGFIII